MRLTLRDDVVSLVDEGLDLGVRIAQLRDSTLRRIVVGSVRRAVYASPAYLAAHGVPKVPADLGRHACIAFAGTAGGIDRWSFGAGGRAVVVPIRPRLVVNLAEPAIDAAIAGVGVTRVLSYMVVDAVRAGRLRPVLQRWEPPAVPVQVVHPAGRHLSPTVRLLVDHLVASLRRRLAG